MLARAFAIVRRAVAMMLAEDGLMVAGYMSFTALLAFFPFVIFLMAIASFLGTEQDVQDIMAQMLDVLPPDVTDTLEPVIEEVVTGRKAGFLTFGIVVALWAASSGIEALRLALNRAYGVTRFRAIWIARLQSLMFVFVLSGLAVVVSIFVVLGPIVWDVVTRFVPLSPGTRAAWFLVRYLLATAGMVVALLLLHHYLPNRPQGWRRIMPGILFTVVALLLGATGFSVYLSYAGNYSITYGGLASVVVSLMFFYVASAIFIFGAYLNRAIERQRQKEESKKRRAEAASRTSSPGTGEAAQLQA